MKPQLLICLEQFVGFEAWKSDELVYWLYIAAN